MGGRPLKTRRKSKSIPRVLDALKSVAQGLVVSDTIAEMATKLERASKLTLRPHRRTGAAEAAARAVPGRTAITLENVAYRKYIKGKGGQFARRLPYDWIKQIKARLRANTRKALRGVA